AYSRRMSTAETVDPPVPAASRPDAVSDQRLTHACPVCGSSRLHYQFSIREHRVVRCGDCGLLLLNPQPSDAELARIYSADYFLLSGEPGGERHVADLKRATAQGYLDLLRRYRGGRTDGELLEIGSGTGDFLV